MVPQPFEKSQFAPDENRKGREKIRRDRAVERGIGADTDRDRLARLRRDDQRAERPVEEGQREAEVLVVVSRVDRVVELMVRRAVQDAAREPGEGDPHPAVAEVPIGEQERHHEDVAAEQREGTHAWPEGIGHRAEDEAGRKTDQIDDEEDLDRVLAKLGEDGHRLGRMVNLMELPQSRDLVQRVVGQPVGEIVSQHLQNRRQREQRGDRPSRRRTRSERMRESRVDRIAPEEEASAQHAVGGGERNPVDQPQADVDLARRMQNDAPREDRTDEAAHARGPGARAPLPDIVERGEGQRPEKRGSAIGRRQAEGSGDDAFEGGPDRGEGAHDAAPEWV